MKIYNVIEIKDNLIVSMKSFGVYEEQLESEIKEDAMEYLKRVVKKRGLEEDIVGKIGIVGGGYVIGSYSINLEISYIE